MAAKAGAVAGGVTAAVRRAKDAGIQWIICEVDRVDQIEAALAGGTTYTIDTRYNKKTVVDQAGTNQISKLAAGSSIASFDLRRGANSILVVGTSTTAATLIVFSYNGQHVAI